jgi:hypothetical protein
MKADLRISIKGYHRNKNPSLKTSLAWQKAADSLRWPAGKPRLIFLPAETILVCQQPNRV